MANNYNQNFNQTNTDYTNPPATHTYPQRRRMEQRTALQCFS